LNIKLVLISEWVNRSMCKLTFMRTVIARDEANILIIIAMLSGDSRATLAMTILVDYSPIDSLTH